MYIIRVEKIAEGHYFSVAHVIAKDDSTLLTSIPLNFENYTEDEARKESYRMTEERIDSLCIVSDESDEQLPLIVDLFYTNAITEGE
jgi:hypothetical protein